MADQLELARSEERRKLQTVNPATEEPGRSCEQHTLDDAREAAAVAHRALLVWRRTSFRERSTVLHKAADILRARKDEFARLMTEEMGKAGSSFVNENVRSDPRTPFGGVKHSGYGRECSALGICEFTNIKTAHVKPQGEGGGSAVE